MLHVINDVSILPESMSEIKFRLELSIVAEAADCESNLVGNPEATRLN